LATAENLLIERLPRGDRARLHALCEPVQLVQSDVLHERGATTASVHFPVDAFVSLVTHLDGGAGLEVGVVGREGMLGVQLVLGVACAPQRAVVRGAGLAWRIGADAFRVELGRSLALQRALLRYVHVLMVQQATAIACMRFHQVRPRLARWLLMSYDRAQRHHFRVTHECLASMLGVRRVGITTAAGELQRLGLIAYHRGELTVLDRAGLESAACGCYAADCRAYDECLERRARPALAASNLLRPCTDESGPCVRQRTEPTQGSV
jgi:CRP-like cAMP-binding protein